MVSTLALKKSDFEAEVGDGLGWGRGVAPFPIWTPEKVVRIQMDVASGLRRFYFCGHPWSFLNPTASIAVPIGETVIQLPDDFGGVDGGTHIICTQDSDGLGRFVLDFTGTARVIQAQALTPTATGIPQMVAQRPVKAIQPGRMQRSELIVYPIPDQVYTFSFPYLITPNYLLDVTQPYAYGGVEHHETIMEFCLAVGEQRRDDRMTTHTAKSEDLIQKSIRLDQRKRPIKLGPNIDRSDNVGGRGYDYQPWGSHGWNMSQGVSVDGVLYD